jgi:hypothetical protein
VKELSVHGIPATEERRKLSKLIEENRFAYYAAGIIAEYGPNAIGFLVEATLKILTKREKRIIRTYEEMINEKYGPDASGILKKARTSILLGREPEIAMTLGEMLKERYGPEATKVISKWQRKMWTKITKILLADLNIEERDASAAAKLTTHIFRDMGEVVEVSPERAVREERICLHSKAWPVEYCELLHIPAMEAIAKTINPKLEARVEKFLSKGDDCCRTVFELKE